MTTPILALFTRSLRLDARARSTYATRAALVAILLIDLLSTSSFTSFGAPGLAFFQSVIYLNLVFITLAGLGYFASAITEEKEEMTLGLLRMTNLDALSILLGKSTSRLYGACLLLLAQLPFTLLAVTLGGVAIGQVLAAYAALLAYIFFLSNAALFCSVICPRTGWASTLTLGLVVAFFWGPSLGMALVGGMEYAGWLSASGAISQGLKWFFQSLLAASPFGRVGEILTTGFAAGPFGFQFWSDLALGALFFFLAWLIFDRCTRESKEAAPSRGLVLRRTSRFRRLRAGRAWRGGFAALVWKDFHFLSGGKIGMLIKTLLLGGWVAYLSWSFLFWYRSSNSGNRSEPLGWSIIASMLTVLMVEIAFAASRIFKNEIKWRTVSSLAMLPLSTRQIAYPKIVAALLAAAPTLVFLALGLLLVVDKFDLGHVGGMELTVLIIFFPAEVLLFLHLTVFLSLRLKWGALPLALAIWYLGNMFSTIGFMFFMREAGWLVGGFILLGISAWLHYMIGLRLQKAAASD